MKQKIKQVLQTVKMTKKEMFEVVVIVLALLWSFLIKGETFTDDMMLAGATMMLTALLCNKGFFRFLFVQIKKIRRRTFVSF